MRVGGCYSCSKKISREEKHTFAGGLAWWADARSVISLVARADSMCRLLWGSEISYDFQARQRYRGMASSVPGEGCWWSEEPRLALRLRKVLAIPFNHEIGNEISERRSDLTRLEGSHSSAARQRSTRAILLIAQLATDPCSESPLHRPSERLRNPSDPCNNRRLFTITNSF